MIKECLPKVEIKLLKTSHARILFLVSLLFKPGTQQPKAGAQLVS